MKVKTLFEYFVRVLLGCTCILGIIVGLFLMVIGFPAIMLLFLGFLLVIPGAVMVIACSSTLWYLISGHNSFEAVNNVAFTFDKLANGKTSRTLRVKNFRYKLVLFLIYIILLTAFINIAVHKWSRDYPLSGNFGSYSEFRLEDAFRPFSTILQVIALYPYIVIFTPDIAREIRNKVRKTTKVLRGLGEKEL